MRILLIGHGKMGTAIEHFAIQRGHTIAATVDLNDVLMPTIAKQADVAIEFTHPDAAFNNIKFCITNKIPVLSGTTGWLNKMPEIEALCKQHDGTFLYASNFSLGVNLFFKLNKELAQLMSRQKKYMPSMVEVHHTEKKDAPSGTAITLAQGIIEAQDHLKEWTLGPAKMDDQLAIAVERIGQVPGTHKITYKSEVDQISIEHEAFSREGFVEGAMLVAEWLPSQKGIKKIDDFLSL
ncbi:MAG: 4-hydroxy-tetrahydrodipicolinate reductase [Marivirga sp.]|jgi:4-hydroxy-tetrahydrodipicolinate reductase